MPRQIGRMLECNVLGSSRQRRALLGLEVAKAFVRSEVARDSAASQVEQLVNVECVNLHGSVITSGGKALAVRAPGHALHKAVMALQGQQFLSAGRVPHLRRLVITGGGEALAVGAEGHSVNSERVAAQGQQFLAALRVPHLRRSVLTGSSEALAVGAPGHSLNSARVAAQGRMYLRRQDCLMECPLRGQ